ncbi:hypothetical protein BC828DRAFT_135660 [Blastocladiella britannica]|nr:hypothetical protein BC828DRAFT_135660 [Blastocladiella britannica]
MASSSSHSSFLSGFDPQARPRQRTGSRSNHNLAPPAAHHQNPYIGAPSPRVSALSVTLEDLPELGRRSGFDDSDQGLITTSPRRTNYGFPWNIPSKIKKFGGRMLGGTNRRLDGDLEYHGGGGGMQYGMAWDKPSGVRSILGFRSPRAKSVLAVVGVLGCCLFALVALHKVPGLGGSGGNVSASPFASSNQVPAPPVPENVPVVPESAADKERVPKSSDADSKPPANAPLPPQEAADPVLPVTEEAPTPLPPPPQREGPFDGRFDAYAVAVRSSIEVSDERLPAVASTWLKPVRNVLIAGDSNVDDVAGTRMTMLDVVSGAFEASQEAMKANGQSVARRNPAAAAANADQVPLQRKPVKLNKNGRGWEVTDDDGYEQIEDVEHLIKRGGAGDTSAATKEKQGWKLDAHKFIPTIRHLRTRFPNASWFVILDDDAYVYMDNLHARLSKLDPNVPHYIGAPNIFAGCDGVRKFGEGPAFAHGGAGIYMSRAAVDGVMRVLDRCIVKYHDCWAGDIRVALCMRDAGVFVTNPFEGLIHQVPPTATTFHFPPRRDQAGACARPITFHHVRPYMYQALHAAEARARQHTSEGDWNATSGWPMEPSNYLYDPTLGNRISRDAASFAPVRYSDIFATMVEGEEAGRGPGSAVGMGMGGPQASAAGPETLDASHGDDIYRDDPIDIHGAGVAECRKHCIDDGERCRAWTLDLNDNKCRLSGSTNRIEEKKGFLTGIVRGRYECTERGL